MITIPETVKQIIEEEPFLEDFLERGLINISELARQIKPEIEKRLMKRVEDGAITMAIKRCVPILRPAKAVRNIFTGSPDIMVRSNLTEVTLAPSDSTLEQVGMLLREAANHDNQFCTATRGVYETAVIYSSVLEEKMKGCFAHERVLVKQENLSAVTLRLPQENVRIPGIYYVILKAFALHDINLIDVVSTNTEFTVLLENKEVDRAFAVLKRLFRVT